jgi:hypothetical protein
MVAEKTDADIFCAELMLDVVVIFALSQNMDTSNA